MSLRLDAVAPILSSEMSKPLPTNLHEALCDIQAGRRYDPAVRWLVLLQKRGLITYERNLKCEAVTGTVKIRRPSIKITQDGLDTLQREDDRLTAEMVREDAAR